MSSGASSVFSLRPNLPEEAHSLYYRFCTLLAERRGQTERQAEAVGALLRSEPLRALPSMAQRSTRLFLMVAKDLLSHGWCFEVGEAAGAAPNGENALLHARPPGYAAKGSGSQSRKEVKRRLRATLTAARDEQLREPSVRKFVARMERPRWHQGVQVSVLDLFADGRKLAQDLRQRLEAPEEVREDLLRTATRPYLQRVTDERDEHTGLRLRDIWRYCRYSWSLPQKTQPGRRMKYLVRDAARDRDPIMGIGALGSSVVQITPRDREIGWTLRALQNAPEEAESNAEKRGYADAREGAPTPMERFLALQHEIARATSEIYQQDFLEDGTLRPGETEEPTEATLARLRETAEEAGLAASRQPPPPDDASLEEAARAPLYRRKRASALADLLQTRRCFAQAEGEDPEDREAQLSRLLGEKDGRQALSRALRSLKKRHVGSEIMNITTCGAIPPYGPLLGGKLTALLMASPQVIHDYHTRYDGHTSYIASRMNGAPLARENRLALLDTTSLYYVGSSQYNRLRMQTQCGEVRYQDIGKTKGYGSVHLSRRTYDALQKLLGKHPDLESHGSGFGNGVNYKIRSIAEGLSHIGLSKVLKHENPRLVYVVPLAENWQEYLTGVDDTLDFVYADVDQPEEETEEVTQFWQERWFTMRAKKPRILKKVEESEPLRVSEFTDEPTPLFDQKKSPEKILALH